MEYGQFCPIAKATEVLGEKWTILIVREILMGGTRFNMLQRGLSLISPTMLSKRLDSLEEAGLILKRKIPNQKGYEYFPTKSCEELLPIIKTLGDWGMRWARENLPDKDCDVELLMLYLKRSINIDNLIGNQTVIRFKFTNLTEHATWWITVEGEEVDICDTDPGKDIDIYFTTDVRTMVKIWMGDTTYKREMKNDTLKVVGHTALVNTISSWMADSMYADLQPASEI
ncbi:MAG: transcriptional regulator [endosymbiont of Galathealinum brachiosum]|uniref:Transcriptional regulator n=1 Tax=endosymbiont of Galathealinum brachiosum TaxID=2200906 RepID=A0A370DBM1_9GAMM|nr:MAG: transcriptional regulator [endosymbiont of Galathealinum brachiosum]